VVRDMATVMDTVVVIVIGRIDIMVRAQEARGDIGDDVLLDRCGQVHAGVREEMWTIVTKQYLRFGPHG
jgi:hypothetical protein